MGEEGREKRCALTAVLFVSGLRRVKIKRESDGAVVGELKTEKKEGLEEGETLWVKGDGSGVVKREGEKGVARTPRDRVFFWAPHFPLSPWTTVQRRAASSASRRRLEQQQ